MSEIDHIQRVALALLLEAQPGKEIVFGIRDAIHIHRNDKVLTWTDEKGRFHCKYQKYG